MLDLKVGDKVTRLLAGTIPMEMVVVAIDGDKIYCAGSGTKIGWEGPLDDFPGWTFDRTFGYEIDEDLGWGVPDENNHIMTGSYLTLDGQPREDIPMADPDEEAQFITDKINERR